MRNSLKKIKLIAFDFDDTLFAHTEHISDTDDREVQYFSKCLKARASNITNSDIWGTCTMNRDFGILLNYCERNNIVTGLISGTSAYVCAEQKIEYVEEKYGYELNNWCVSSQAHKIFMLKALANFYNLSPEQILIVDDNYKVLTTAGDNGFENATPIELINYIENNLGEIVED